MKDHTGVLVSLILVVALSLLAPIRHAGAVICSSTLTFDRANVVSDCSGNSTEIFTDAVARQPFFFGIGFPSKAPDWFTDVHITMPDDIGASLMSPANNGNAAFFRNYTDETDWIVEIQSSTISFFAPSSQSRVDPDDKYSWAAFFGRLLDEDDQSVNIDISYTMDVPVPSTLLLLGLGFAGLGLVRCRRRADRAHGATRNYTVRRQR